MSHTNPSSNSKTPKNLSALIAGMLGGMIMFFSLACFSPLTPYEKFVMRHKNKGAQEQIIEKSSKDLKKHYTNFIKILEETIYGLSEEKKVIFLQPNPLLRSHLADYTDEIILRIQLRANSLIQEKKQ